MPGLVSFDRPRSLRVLNYVGVIETPCGTRLEILPKTTEDAETVEEVVQASVGQIFSRVLEDAGVYKRTEEGQEAFMRFVQSVGIKP